MTDATDVTSCCFAGCYDLGGCYAAIPTRTSWNSPGTAYGSGSGLYTTIYSQWYHIRLITLSLATMQLFIAYDHHDMAALSTMSLPYWFLHPRTMWYTCTTAAISQWDHYVAAHWWRCLTSEGKGNGLRIKTFKLSMFSRLLHWTFLVARFDLQTASTATVDPTLNLCTRYPFVLCGLGQCGFKACPRLLHMTGDRNLDITSDDHGCYGIH
jgi:hypothetical protein